MKIKKEQVDPRFVFTVKHSGDQYAIFNQYGKGVYLTPKVAGQIEQLSVRNNVIVRLNTLGLSRADAGEVCEIILEGTTCGVRSGNRTKIVNGKRKLVGFGIVVDGRHDEDNEESE